MKSATTWRRWRQSHEGSQWCPGCWNVVRYWEFSDCCPGIGDAKVLADDLYELELCVLVPNFVLVSRYLWISNCSGDRNVHCLSLIICYRLRVHWGSHWLEKFGSKFWRDFLRHFSSKQWEIEIYTRRSSFPFDTRKVNTGFIWQWILRIFTKLYGGCFSRF